MIVRYAIIGIIWAIMFFLYSRITKRHLDDELLIGFLNVTIWPVMIFGAFIDMFNATSNFIKNIFTKKVEDVDEEDE